MQPALSFPAFSFFFWNMIPCPWCSPSRSSLEAGFFLERQSEEAWRACRHILAFAQLVFGIEVNKIAWFCYVLATLSILSSLLTGWWSVASKVNFVQLVFATSKLFWFWDHLFSLTAIKVVMGSVRKCAQLLHLLFLLLSGQTWRHSEWSFPQPALRWDASLFPEQNDWCLTKQLRYQFTNAWVIALK